MSASSTCLPRPTAAAYTISSPANLALPTPSTWVTRNGSALQLDGRPFVAVGANIYWLGLDENVSPSPSYPSESRVLEAMAIAAAMGATTIRSQTLGISYGTGLSVENALGQTKEAAFAAIDWAVWAAKSYGLRLVLPLTDQYDYYHGGIPTFLRWRNLSSTDYSPFYDTSSAVHSDFTAYLDTLLSHRSNITGLTLGEEPAILAFETGNELGGWGGNSYPPPVEWTTAIAAKLKALAPNTLVIDGSYGVRKDNLDIADVDIYSDHYYPPYTSNLRSSADLAASHDKAFITGEYDWTDRYYHPLIYLAVIAPVVLAALLWVLPRRWWPCWVGAGCCSKRRRARKPRGYEGVAGGGPLGGDGADNKSQAELPLSPGEQTYPPQLNSAAPPPPPPPRGRGFWFRRLHLALLIVVILCPLLGGLISRFLPSPLSSFLSTTASLAATSSSPQLSGSLYWSLFGRDDQCCAYVQHADGYTLHYPSVPGGSGDSAGSGQKVLELTRSAWKLRGEEPAWLASGETLDGLGLSGLPVVACPQEALAVPANATWTGGNGTIAG